MYTTTSKQQEGYTFKDSHPKCFITTNSTAKLSPGAENRGDVHVLIVSYKGQFETFCNKTPAQAFTPPADEKECVLLSSRLLLYTVQCY